jgi:hypothetical protein
MQCSAHFLSKNGKPRESEILGHIPQRCLQSGRGCTCSELSKDLYSETSSNPHFGNHDQRYVLPRFKGLTVSTLQYKYIPTSRYQKVKIIIIKVLLLFYQRNWLKYRSGTSWHPQQALLLLYCFTEGDQKHFITARVT